MKKTLELVKMNIGQIREGLLKKDFSALELTRAFLERIEQEDKEIGSYLTVCQETALSQAKEVDDMILEKREIPYLAGIPSAIKDNILVKDIRCTAGSKILENYIAPYDATCVKKLKKEKTVILGKTNLDEFAMGSSTENSAFYPAKNPWDKSRVPGGSSGGSAAAVAKGLCAFALGSDTGGSIRQPAAFCGAAGLKPTYGTVSRYGLIAFASSLDQIGVIAKNVQDLKAVFEVIKGKDKMDSTSVDTSLKEKKGKRDVQRLKAGIPKEYLVKGMEEGVERAVKEAIKKCQEQGIRIEEISLPHTEYALAVYYIIAPSEASANLARYDGIKYGSFQARSQVKDLQEFYFKTRGQGFGKEVRRRIMIGAYALSAGYYEAYYLRAQKVRTLIKNDFKEAFQKVDLILSPCAPTTAFKIGEKITDPLSMYLSDIFTVSVNLAGLPAVSLPCGRADNLPVGLQIIGRPFEEDTIFEFAQFCEKIWTQ